MQRGALVTGSEERDVIRVEGNKDEAPIETITREDGVRVSWHDGIEVIPGKLRVFFYGFRCTYSCQNYTLDQWSFIMAHEFFDALPIHSFEVHLHKVVLSYLICLYQTIEN